MSHKLSSF